VLASRGSVIPLFHDQIRNGGPLTLTVPKMTRFLLTINQAVDTVFAALRSAKPGETYVPDAPSATILNLAKALLGDRKIKIEIIGIRPGEKMHEIMVSEEEVHHCIKRGGYYVIRPMLPELGNIGKRGPNALTKEFSSADNVLSLKETTSLLKKHRLMVEDVDLSQQGELLR
jgi:UDP-glucose 4-epimerase